MKGKLILQDGKVFKGKIFGALDQFKPGEVVFNTSMTGYQEILTDPSYYGQIVTMTYPLIGNYGINPKYNQSENIQVKGFIIKELSDIASNWLSKESLNDFMKKNKIIGLSGIDTRALTKHIRNKSTMAGMIVKENTPKKEVLPKIKKFENIKPVFKVTTEKNYILKGKNKNGKKIAVIDFGIKENILKNLQKRASELKVFKASFNSKEVFDYNPDGVFLSNGPGDPKTLTNIIKNLKPIVKKYSTFGICLGHQLIALIYGLDTKKMDFGHRGANHPVINKVTNKVYITSQNHGYEVVGNSKLVDITYENVNDKSIEGLKIKNKDIFSVQFHPEASPGPVDFTFIFDEFFNQLEVA